MENKWINMKTLNDLNEESVKRGYNRNIWVNIIEDKMKECMKEKNISWKGEDTQVCLIPLMEHKHKGGEPCETHIRCILDTGHYLGGSNPTLDVPMEMFRELESF